MSIHNNCGLCKASVVNLSVYDGDEAIIYDVNMEFHCGEITALIGKNGSGKTTLIKALLGERPHTGNITCLLYTSSLDSEVDHCVFVNFVINASLSELLS